MLRQLPPVTKGHRSVQGIAQGITPLLEIFPSADSASDPLEGDRKGSLQPESGIALWKLQGKYCNAHVQVWGENLGGLHFFSKLKEIP